MQIEIQYKGDFGQGSFLFELEKESSYQALIEQVHQHTGREKTYTIWAGNPMAGGRKEIEVGYDYEIEHNGQWIDDFSQPIAQSGQAHEMIVYVSGANKVD